ncbi:IPT/TIG domain-containing protein [Streptomyces sp. C10]|uniref:IPT/TIG domain-containing protein n=1 Tax=Streptomyces sp. C10 TaxID=531941 RepID=UPI00397FC596
MNTINADSRSGADPPGRGSLRPARFAYSGPAPVVVSAVSPRSGKAGSQVTIDGSGFAQGAAVRFKDTAAAGPVTVKSPAQIVATVPSRLPEPKTVDVTVTVGVATSPTVPGRRIHVRGLSLGAGRDVRPVCDAHKVAD